ncbi:hypothetical protein CC78DRAFT_580278 [Lojkania enalia]|uniref:Uncharacterized protein n=1 Tax=Lojkania enalia TaxID=147567 RepID=A0A9P4N047_9PLEO|nr:hypothetical protein CC78DRAFT_580278 [Didymosphaeria enalia]
MALPRRYIFRKEGDFAHDSNATPCCIKQLSPGECSFGWRRSRGLGSRDPPLFPSEAASTPMPPLVSPDARAPLQLGEARALGSRDRLPMRHSWQLGNWACGRLGTADWRVTLARTRRARALPCCRRRLRTAHDDSSSVMLSGQLSCASHRRRPRGQTGGMRPASTTTTRLPDAPDTVVEKAAATPPCAKESAHAPPRPARRGLRPGEAIHHLRILD